MAGRVPYKINKTPIVSDNPHQMISPGMPKPPNFLPGHNNDRWGGGGSRHGKGDSHGGFIRPPPIVPQNIGNPYKWEWSLKGRNKPMYDYYIPKLQAGTKLIYMQAINVMIKEDYEKVMDLVWKHHALGVTLLWALDPYNNHQVIHFIPDAGHNFTTFSLHWDNEVSIQIDVYPPNNNTMDIWISLDVHPGTMGGKAYASLLGVDMGVGEDVWMEGKEEVEMKDKKTMVSDFVNTVMMTRRMAKGLNIIEEDEKVEKMDVFM